MLLYEYRLYALGAFLYYSFFTIHFSLFIKLRSWRSFFAALLCC